MNYGIKCVIGTHKVTESGGDLALELRYGQLNHMEMWRTLKRNGQIRVNLDSEQAEVFEYLVKRISFVSDLTLTSPTYKGFQLFGLFLVNLRLVYKLWFKYRNLAEIDQLRLLYKNLSIKPLHEEGEHVFLLK